MDIRQTAVDRTAGLEKFVGYLYLDTAGKVTVGYGRMLPDSDSATSIALKSKGAEATEKAKQDEWTKMSTQDVGHPASYYKKFTTLTLDENDAKSMLRDDLTTAASSLATRFPSLDEYPNAAQDALLDMMFNIGITKFTKAKWPTLFAAVEKKDWKAAAGASHPSEGRSRRSQ